MVPAFSQLGTADYSSQKSSCLPGEHPDGSHVFEHLATTRSGIQQESEGKKLTRIVSTDILLLCSMATVLVSSLS
jgi:hypothetical protein